MGIPAAVLTSDSSPVRERGFRASLRLCRARQQDREGSSVPSRLSERPQPHRESWERERAAWEKRRRKEGSVDMSSLFSLRSKRWRDDAWGLQDK